MKALEIPSGDAPLRVLAVGAHSDDIEIGCGGTLLELVGQRDVVVDWVVCAAAGARGDEARASAEAFLQGAKDVRLVMGEFRDAFFPYIGAELKEFFEGLKSDCAPDVIFTHRGADAHQDHRLVSELTWNTFRDHVILEFEVPKYDGDMGAPNVFVPLAEETCRRKVDLLMEHFASQRSRRWFTPDLFHGLMRLRGMEANAASGRAEAFYARKIVLRGGAT